jgi:hypothetical protein
MEFFGTTDTILQRRLYESIGFEILTLIATVSNIRISVNLSDLLAWDILCSELDDHIRKNTNERTN